MDRRLADRRRKVAEERARHRLSRLLRLLVAAAVLSFVAWLLQSPFLSVGAIEVSGASQVDVISALAEEDVVVGHPMVLVSASDAERRLLEDPWVADAMVARDWPTTVAVTVTERVPAATVRLGDELWLASGDGALLETTDTAAAAFGLAELPSMTADQGDSLEVVGAVEYLASLTEDFRQGATVRLGEEGLEATVGGFSVRLGGPFEMSSKARVTEAMLRLGLASGSVITVVSPASPAVLPPGGSMKTTTTTAPDSP